MRIVDAEVVGLQENVTQKGTRVVNLTLQLDQEGRGTPWAVTFWPTPDSPVIRYRDRVTGQLEQNNFGGRMSIVLSRQGLQVASAV